MPILISKIDHIIGLTRTIRFDYDVKIKSNWGEWPIFEASKSNQIEREVCGFMRGRAADFTDMKFSKLAKDLEIKTVDAMPDILQNVDQ